MDSIDDDFGELYADVEVQVKTISDNVPDFTKLYAQAEETDKNTNFKSEEKRVSLEADDDDDSEDELRIVLNDEDCEKFPVTGGGGGAEEEADGLELDSNNDDKNNGDSCKLQQQQHLQYKYIRSNGSINGYTGTASFASMLARGDWKESGCNQGKGSVSVVPQCAYGFSLPRYRTILDVDIDAFEKKPWNHSEANLSDFFNFGFNEDSWKSYCGLLGQLRDHTSMQARNAVYESSKINQAYEVGFDNEKIVLEARAMHSNRVRSSLKFSDWGERPWELPKVRAIEVEDGIRERQPSMDVKHPRMQDSDVVIQINVQDCTEDFSSSGKEECGHTNTNCSDHETSTNGDLDLDRNRGVSCCGSASRDEVSANSHEKDVRSADLSSDLRRFSEPRGASNQTDAGSDDRGNGLISDGDGHRHQNLSVHGLERASKAMEELKWPEEVDGRKVYNSDLFLETEISLADRSHFSLSPSFSGNNSDVSKNSSHGDPVRVCGPSECQSPNSGTEVIADNKDSISYGIYRKPDDRQYHLKRRSHNREDWKRHSRRCQGVTKLKTYPKPDDDYSPLSDDEDDVKDFSRHVPVREKWKNCHGIRHTVSEKKFQPENAYYPEREGLCNGDYKSFRRQRQRLTDLEYHDTEEFSFNNKEAVFSSGYGSERFGDKHFKFVQQKYPRGKNHQRIRDWIDPYVSSRWDEREYCHERSARVDNEDYIGRDQYYHKRGDGESRLYVPKYSSTLSERDTKWRSKNDKPLVRRIDQDWCLHEFEEDDFVQEKYARSVSFTDRERDYVDTMYERDLPFIGREEKISVQRARYGDSHCLDLDTSWSTDIENEYQRCMKHESSTSQSRRECFRDNKRRWHDSITSIDDVYDSKLTERYRRYGRHIYDEEHRDIDLSGICKVTDDTEDSILDADDWVHPQRRRHSWQSKELHRMEDELIATDCDNELFAEKLSFSYNKTSMCERIHLKYEYDHNGMLSDDVQLEHHRYKLTREESSSKCVNKNYDIINRGEREHTVPRCRDSVDWIVGEVKSSGRWSKGRSLMCSGKVEKLDLKLAKEQKNLVFKDSHEFDRGQAAGTHMPKIESDRSNGKWLDKVPVTEPNEELDIEEGQIVTEETYTEKDLEKKNSSESTASTSSVKKRISSSENASGENKAVGEYDSQRLLETLAKMEKRRERFKDYILPKKQQDNNPDLKADLMVDSPETKQQRPARKRRWNQS